MGISVLLIFLGVCALSAAWAGMSAAPWLPTRNRDLRRALTLAQLRPGMTVVDLGCGDGRLLFAAAAYPGVRAVGYELSVVPWLAAWVRWCFSPVRRRVRIRFGSLYRAPLRDADVVFCFLLPVSMRRLRRMLARTLPARTLVISAVFPIAGVVPLWRDKPTPQHSSLYGYSQQTLMSAVDGRAAKR